MLLIELWGNHNEHCWIHFSHAYCIDLVENGFIQSVYAAVNSAHCIGRGQKREKTKVAQKNSEIC